MKKKKKLQNKEKNYIQLVLPNEEISLRPELSSSPRFRIQGGYPERDERRTNERMEILVSNIGSQNLFLIQFIE